MVKVERYFELILVVVCLIGAFCTGVIAYHKGIVVGRQESERLFAAQLRGLERMVDEVEIKALRCEGRK